MQPVLFVLAALQAACASASLNFISFGDWGITADSDPKFSANIQSLVAAQMANACDKYHCKFLIDNGDNFYDFGVKNVTDKLWTLDYTNIYNYPSLQIPWYITEGNHDYYGPGLASAQIDYYKMKMDNRWIFPNYYYKVSFYEGDDNGYLTLNDGCSNGYYSDVTPLLDVFMVDTQILALENYKNFNLYLQKPTTADQIKHLKWLDNQLSCSKATWKIVVGHYPMKTVNAGDVVPGLIQPNASLGLDISSSCLLNLVVKYDVDVYMCGHDHTLQDNVYKNIRFLVNGNGAQDDSVPAPSVAEAAIAAQNATTNFNIADPGFMIHELDSEKMTVHFIDHNGTEIYSYTQYVKSRVRRHLRTAENSSAVSNTLLWGGVLSVCGLLTVFIVVIALMKPKRAISNESVNRDIA